MNRSSANERIERLEQLKSLLKSGEPLTARDIAQELQISVRTVNRDIDVLRGQGVPIEAERGRGGGIRLHRHWGVGRVNFNYPEAVDLLITLAIAQQMKSPIFMANLEAIRRKLFASLSPQMKEKVKNLKRRVLIMPSASLRVLSSFSSPRRDIAEQLHQAFLMQQRITMQYKAIDEAITTRTIEPHFFLLSYPVWYILAWDLLRRDIRTFRCDRIQSIEVLDHEFQLLPVSRFMKAIEGASAI